MKEVSNQPTKPKLYAKVKSEAKKKFDVYPSAYANGWLVKEYRRRGGGYKRAGLDQWFKEKWVDVSKKGDHEAGHAECGRDKADKKGYPKCVPASKARSMSKKEKRSAVQRKRKALSKKKGLPKKPVMVKTDMEKQAGSATTGAVLGGLAGGGLNALRQHRKNKKDPSNKKSLLSAAAKGGVAGGVVGAGAGAMKGKLDAIKNEVRKKSMPQHEKNMKEVNDKYNNLMDSINKSKKAGEEWDKEFSKMSALQKIAAKYKGKKVTLNKPISTPGARKKSKVYVKNDKGNVVMVRFGDPNMSIKKDDPARRKSFRARHNCDNPGPKWKARYWSCKAW